MSEISSQTNVTTIDWAIVVVYPLIPVVIELAVRKYVRTWLTIAVS